MADAKMADEKDLAFAREIKQRFTNRRWLVERGWWGNILYLMGVQWIIYDVTARRWRMRKLSPSVPTPISNMFRSTADTVKSVMAQHDPRFLATPMRDDPHAVAAAADADTNLQVLLQEGKFRKTRRRMLDWLITCGTCFVEPVFDDSEDTGMDEIPYEACPACKTEFAPDDKRLTERENPDDPSCPVCGTAELTESETQTQSVPRGQMRLDVKSPFETYLDPAIEELDDQPIILNISSYTTEQVYLRWNVEVAQESEYVTNSGYMKEAAATVAAPGVGLGTAAQGGSERQNRVSVYRIFCKYHKDYPKGCYLAMTAGGTFLEKKTPYPWKRRANGRMFFPMVAFRFGTAPGRFWGYTPLDDLLPKQYQLNKAESLYTMIIARMANPVWLIPTNSNPTRITGEIGIQIEYTPSGGAKPERSNGSEAPMSLFKYIESCKQYFDELSGAFSAVRGRAIGTRTPVGTTQALMDRGFGRWATVFDGLEEGYEDLAKNALEIWRQSSGSPRVQAVKNALGGWTFKEFERASWDDNVDIQVEAGSTRPRTQQEKLQNYEQLIQAGLINIQDQAQVIKVLEDTGNAHLMVGVEEDTKAAYKENADFMVWAQEIDAKVAGASTAGDPGVQESTHAALSVPPIMVHPLVDNHALHFLAHRRLCLTGEFKMLSEATQMGMFNHMLEHKMDLGQSQIAPMMMPAPIQNVKAPMPAGKPAGGAQPPTTASH